MRSTDCVTVTVRSEDIFKDVYTLIGRVMNSADVDKGLVRIRCPYVTVPVYKIHF